MRGVSLVLLALLCACAGRPAGHSGPATHPRSSTPVGWSKGGAQPDLYEVGIDDSVRHGGERSAYIAARDSVSRASWATLSQGIDASGLIGRRIRVAAWIRRDSPGPCQAFVGIDGESEGRRMALAFSSEIERPQACGIEWTQFAIVVDIPILARRMVYGFRLSGPGRVWIDDVTIEPAGDSLAPSPQLAGLPAVYSEAEVRVLDSIVVEMKAGGEWTERPTNLGFEE